MPGRPRAHGEPQPASVLIGDDHPPLRALLRGILERSGYFVCGDVGDAAAAIDLAMKAQPDICLVDINMPGNGIAATAAITAMVPNARVVMLTVSRSESDLFRAIEAGAVGYVLKGGNLEQLSDILRRVLEGEALLSGGLIARVLDEFRRRGRRRTRLTGQQRATLSRREWEVLELMADDLNTVEIAQRLAIQDVTVRSHVASILRKLQVDSRQAALRLLRENRSGSPYDR